MKKLYILIPVLVMTFMFGRVSNKHAANISPSDLSFNSQKGELSSGSSEDTSIRWKRRHKKRKKTRRPQRGR